MMSERKYIIKESDLNGLMSILGDSIPKTMNLDSIFAIHSRVTQNLREYTEPVVAPEQQTSAEGDNGEKH